MPLLSLKLIREKLGRAQQNREAERGRELNQLEEVGWRTKRVAWQTMSSKKLKKH